MTPFEIKMLDEAIIRKNMTRVDILQRRVNAIGQLDRLLCSPRRLSSVFEILCITGPAHTSLLWGLVALIIQVSKDSTNHVKRLERPADRSTKK